MTWSQNMIKGRGVVIKPAKSIVDEITGAMKKLEEEIKNADIANYGKRGPSPLPGKARYPRN